MPQPKKKYSRRQSEDDYSYDVDEDDEYTYEYDDDYYTEEEYQYTYEEYERINQHVKNQQASSSSNDFCGVNEFLSDMCGVFVNGKLDEASVREVQINDNNDGASTLMTTESKSIPPLPAQKPKTKVQAQKSLIMEVCVGDSSLLHEELVPDEIAFSPKSKAQQSQSKDMISPQTKLKEEIAIIKRTLNDSRESEGSLLDTVNEEDEENENEPHRNETQTQTQTKTSIEKDPSWDIQNPPFVNVKSSASTQSDSFLPSITSPPKPKRFHNVVDTSLDKTDTPTRASTAKSNEPKNPSQESPSANAPFDESPVLRRKQLRRIHEQQDAFDNDGESKLDGDVMNRQKNDIENQKEGSPLKKNKNGDELGDKISLTENEPTQIASDLFHVDTNSPTKQSQNTNVQENEDEEMNPNDNANLVPSSPKKTISITSTTSSHDSVDMEQRKEFPKPRVLHDDLSASFFESNYINSVEDKDASLETSNKARKLDSSSNWNRTHSSSRPKKKLWWIILLSILLIIIIAVTVRFTSTGKSTASPNSTNDNDNIANNIPSDIFQGISSEPSLSPSHLRTPAPTSIPSIVSSDTPSTLTMLLFPTQPEIVDLISSISSPNEINDPTTAQYKSLIWLLQDPFLHSSSNRTRKLITIEDFRIVQRYVLMVLYYAMNGEGWTENGGFGRDDTECLWQGIVCDDDSRIIELGLGENNLQGSLISEIGEFTFLQILLMDMNFITGNIPESLSQLQNLQILSLYSNALDGTIPTELGTLLFLEELHLYDNQFEGSIPLDITNLSNLGMLSLQMNQLTGTLPNEFGNMTSLEFLRVHSNKLTGSIPTSITFLENLRLIDLDNNNLSGEIPFEIVQLPNLQAIYLNRNDLTGMIPIRIGLLEELVILEISQNNISGSMPTGLCRLTGLQIINLNENKLTGRIPTCFGALSSMRILNLNTNSITATIPTTIGNMRSMERLLLGDNSLNGRIPSVLGNLERLEILDLSFNSFTGRIPTTLGLLTQLSVLHLNDNELRGNVLFLQNLVNLESIVLSKNSLEGTVSDEICGLDIDNIVVDCSEVFCDCCDTCV